MAFAVSPPSGDRGQSDSWTQFRGIRSLVSYARWSTELDSNETGSDHEDNTFSDGNSSGSRSVPSTLEAAEPVKSHERPEDVAEEMQVMVEQTWQFLKSRTMINHHPVSESSKGTLARIVRQQRPHAKSRSYERKVQDIECKAWFFALEHVAAGGVEARHIRKEGRPEEEEESMD